MGIIWSIFSKFQFEGEENQAESPRVLEQYAAQVLDFSSQYGSERSFSYTARNCLGTPSRFPRYGDYPQTFVPRFIPHFEQSEGYELCSQIRNLHHGRFTPKEFVDLRFNQMVNVHAIYIYETLNPGSIVNIWGGDCKGNWQNMWNGSDSRPTYSHAPRQFGPPIDCLSKPISMVRIYFNSYQIKSYSAIDAVCLLGTLQDEKGTEEGPIYKLILEKKLHLRMMTLEDQLMDKKERRHQLNLSDDGYFNSLPREIILFILSHLDFRSLIQCCQVSKSFRDIASDPLLYSRLELKHLWHKVSNATLKSVFRKTKLLKYLDISHCGNYGRLTPVTLRTFIYARGAKLTNLLLQNCHAATKIVLVSIGATCKQLVDLDLSNLHYIETGNFGPIALLNNLQQLNLYRTRIGTRELSDIIKSNASTLRALYLGSCLRIDADKICEILSNESCNMLSVLDLWRSNSLTSRGVTHLSSISSLIDLDLGTYLSS